MSWAELLGELSGLLAGERDPIANAANTAALIFARVPRVNWAGFYFLHGGELVLGPFQGLPACVRIPLGRGVCGAAAVRRETILVPDVHAFADHIACDSASNAELVVPLVSAGWLFGVLDLDSPDRGRFEPEDQAGAEAVARAWIQASDLSAVGWSRDAA